MDRITYQAEVFIGKLKKLGMNISDVSISLTLPVDIAPGEDWEYKVLAPGGADRIRITANKAPGKISRVRFSQGTP